MQVRSKFDVLRNKLGAGLALSVLAVPAFAQGSGTTGSLSGLSGIFSNLDTTDIIAAFIAGGTVIAAVGFAKWGTKKASRFFG